MTDNWTGAKLIYDGNEARAINIPELFLPSGKPENLSACIRTGKFDGQWHEILEDIATRVYRANGYKNVDLMSTRNIIEANMRAGLTNPGIHGRLHASCLPSAGFCTVLIYGFDPRTYCYLASTIMSVAARTFSDPSYLNKTNWMVLITASVDTWKQFLSDLRHSLRLLQLLGLNENTIQLLPCIVAALADSRYTDLENLPL